jgi:hypothetical protein
MKKQTPANSDLALIWGDTVNLKHLGGAMIIGMALGILFYQGGLLIIENHFSSLPENLHKSVALLVGIVGCLLAAVISAKCFPPKRVVSEQEFSPEDRERVLRELQIDPEREAEALKTMSPAILQEMEELQLLELFQAPRKNPAEQPQTREG